MAGTNSHADAFLDFRRIMAEWRMPSFDLEAVAQYQRKNFAALTQANQMAMEGTQAWMRRNLELARESMDDLSAMFGELGKNSGTMEVRLARHAELSKKVLEKGLANMRDLTELVTKTNSDTLGVIGKRVTESLDEVRDLTQKAA